MLLHWVNVTAPDPFTSIVLNDPAAVSLMLDVIFFGLRTIEAWSVEVLSGDTRLSVSILATLGVLTAAVEIVAGVSPGPATDRILSGAIMLPVVMLFADRLTSPVIDPVETDSQDTAPIPTIFGGWVGTPWVVKVTTPLAVLIAVVFAVSQYKSDIP